MSTAISWAVGDEPMVSHVTPRHRGEISFPAAAIGPRIEKSQADVLNEYGGERPVVTRERGRRALDVMPHHMDAPSLIARTVDYFGESLRWNILYAHTLPEQCIYAAVGDKIYGSSGAVVDEAVSSRVAQEARKIFCSINAMRTELQPTPAERLRDQLQSLQAEAVGEHPDPGSRYPVIEAFEDARKVAACLDLNSCDLPIVTMAGDGELNFFWDRESDGLKVDMGFYGTGTYSCYARKGDMEVFEDDVPAADGLRASIAALLPEE